MAAMTASKITPYTLPTDAPEGTRLDRQHELFRLTFNGRLILAPIPPSPTLILDIGCGTSSWGIEIARNYPDTKVIGLDLGGQTQPSSSTIPQNYAYQTGDFQETWPFSSGQADYIHTRFINHSISNYTSFISEALRCLKPGGYFEIQDFWLPGPTTVPLVADHWKFYVEVALSMGRDFQAMKLHWHKYLTDGGFMNVQHEDFEWRIGPKKDETDPKKRHHDQEVLDNYVTGIKGFTFGFFTRGAGWSEEQVDACCAEVRNAMLENPGESVMPLRVFWAQKPE